MNRFYRVTGNTQAITVFMEEVKKGYEKQNNWMVYMHSVQLQNLQFIERKYIQQENELWKASSSSKLNLFTRRFTLVKVYNRVYVQNMKSVQNCTDFLILNISRVCNSK